MADSSASTSVLLTVDEALDFSSPGRVSWGSSVLEDDAVVEFGRTYHSYKQGSYLLPNDGEEQARLDLQHKVVTLLLDGKLSWAPIDKPAKVLDIGTGTGIWAIEFAKQYPDSTVIGTDLSLIQPEGVVPNCSFIKEDAENDDWTLNEKFDYIHWRLMFTCFTNVSSVIQKIWDHLEPGGWVEFQDHTPETLSQDGSTHGTALEKYGNIVIQALSRLGRDSLSPRKYKALLEAQGFTDVTETVLPYPVGGWPLDPKFKTVGKYLAENVSAALEGTSLKTLMLGGLSADEVRDLAAEIRGEMRSGKVHGYAPFYIVHARKPIVS